MAGRTANPHCERLFGYRILAIAPTSFFSAYQRSMSAQERDHCFMRRHSPLLRPLKWLEGRLDRAADAIVTSYHNAESALRDMIHDYSDRIVTVPDAVNTHSFAPSSTEVEW